MSPETLMQIGSITKLLNAAIVLSVAHAGLLDLDAPLKHQFPDLQIADNEASRTLTIRQLLSMSSGLDNGPYIYPGYGEDALALYVRKLVALPRHFSPGKFFGYSNAGACIAGYLASRATGKPWETLLREILLEPASLTQAAILDEDTRHRRVSVGHLRSPDGTLSIVEPTFTRVRARAPSGPSLAMSAKHLARFGQLLLSRGTADTGARVLSNFVVDLLMSPQLAVPTRKYGDAWCLGPVTGNWNGTQVWGHGGTSATSTSFLYWFPQRQGVIAFIVNTHAAMGEFSRIVFDDVLQVAFGFSKPRIDLPDDSLPPLQQDRYFGIYQDLGMKMEVSRGEGETVRARLVPKPIAGEMGINRLEQTMTLTPLGRDRFLINPSDGPDRHRGIIDLAFYGDDGEGRATNVLNLVFPMSRTAT
jgi:CubicO group peptidase (beta-lactamase class C family)